MQRGPFPTYHDVHKRLIKALRRCAEEALGKDCVQEETAGLVVGTQERPGDSVLFLDGTCVAVDGTVARIQTPTDNAAQAAKPGAPVMDAEQEKPARQVRRRAIPEQQGV